MRRERWGIMGGVFDPIHYAHLVIAVQTAEALELDRVVFVPANVPVHKEPAYAAAADRLAMVEAAISDNPRFAVNTLELDSSAPGYSVDTVSRLAATHPDASWTFILSAESASHLPEWHEPERLVDLAEIAVVPRLGHAHLSKEWLEKHFPGREDRFTFVATSVLGHSSSDIRARLAAGRSIRYLVPPAVERYIGENSLYGAHDRQEA